MSAQVKDATTGHIHISDLYIPGVILILFLLFLGFVSLSLLGNVQDKETKLSDINALLVIKNSDLISLSNQITSLTNSYNTVQSQVTALIGQVTTLSAQNTSYAGQVSLLTNDNNKLLFDINLRVLDLNKWKYDYNVLLLDRNNLIIVQNDINARGKRLYTAFDKCYWAAKCADVNNSVCAIKYGFIDTNILTGVSASALIQANTLRLSCSGYTDSNIGDYNYFK